MDITEIIKGLEQLKELSKSEQQEPQVALNKKNVNLKDSRGFTKLHYAIFYNDIVSIKNFVQAGADVNMRSTSEKIAPLHIAVFLNNEEIVELLLQTAADVEIREESGFTPLVLAASLGHTDIAKLLLKAGANIDEKTIEQGLTPLMVATIQGHPDIVKFLIQAGANLNLFSKAKMTALSYAKSKKHKDIIDFFNLEKVKGERSVDNTEIEMIDIQGGTFTMGNANAYNNAERDVTLGNFSISKNVVSQAKWKEIMNTNPSFYKDDSFPVEQVTWNQIQEFVKKLNNQTGKAYRLPTEAEWEYAAKYRNDIVFGNLNEWCNDWYEAINRPSFFKKLFGGNATQKNPTGPSYGTQKVGRNTKDYRSGYNLNYKYQNLGFRLAYSSN